MKLDLGHFHHLICHQWHSSIRNCVFLFFLSGQREEELPTLLHFAAKYGLKNLTALLLTCPGALQAYSVANKYGHYPNNIAEKHGFKDLRQFIDEYVVKIFSLSAIMGRKVPGLKLNSS